MNYAAEAITVEGVPVEVFDVGVTHKVASYFGNYAGAVA